MLKPEVARQQLGELKSKKHRQARVKRLQALPKPLAALGLGVLGLLPTGKPPKEYADRGKLERSSAAKLTADGKARAKVFAALFPTIAADVEAGWQLKGRLPYTVGYARRAFRAPGRPEAFTATRQTYVERLVSELGEYPDDVLSAEWLAAWAVHLSYHADELGYLLAGVIDAGGPNADAVLEIVKDSAASRHDIGGPGRHAIRAILCCARPTAWDFAEKLLLAAQRQEGLRQSLLEAVDEAHPEAFRRMLALLLDQNLLRFASVARAASVWFGAEQSVENPKQLRAALEGCRDLLADDAVRQKAIAKGDAEVAYRGLWAVAFVDVESALAAAAPLLKDKDAGRRFAAAKLVAESSMPAGTALMLPLLNDPDPRLVSAALSYFNRLPDFDDGESEGGDRYPKGLFERVEAIVPGLPPKPKELTPPVAAWYVAPLGQESAADLLLACLGKRPAERLLPYFGMLTGWTRVRALDKLCEPRTLASDVRQLLLSVAGEPNQSVREAALKYLKKSKLAEDEVRTIEGYLNRKTPDFRRSVFELLLNRPDKLAAGSVDRLLSAGDSNQRAAGLELARRMVEGQRQAEPVRTRLRSFIEARGKRLSATEAQAVEAVLSPAAAPPTLADGLGLFDPADRSPVVPPKSRKVKFTTPAATAFVKELDALIHNHRDKTFTDSSNKDRPVEKVLGSIRYRWDFPGYDGALTPEQNRANLPLADLWDAWWRDRPAKTRDADGFELLRAKALPLIEVREGEKADDDDGLDDDEFDDDDDVPKSKAADKPSPLVAVYQTARELLTPGGVAVRYDDLIERLIEWFAKLYPPAGASDFLLDAAEAGLALVPAAVVAQTPRDDTPADGDKANSKAIDFRKHGGFDRWLTYATEGRGDPGWTPAHDARLYRLWHWRDEPVPGAVRDRPELPVLVAGYKAQAATRTDFLDDLIGPRERGQWGNPFDTLNTLTRLTGSKTSPRVAQRPELLAALDAVVARVVEVELDRGETPTAATPAANAVQHLSGLDTLLRLVGALGKTGFVQGPSYGSSLNKPAVLTHLIRQSVPRDDDTPAAFAAAVKEAVAAGKFAVERVAELGLVNPRWMQHVQLTLGWPGYDEAVYWLIAHTGSSWQSQLGGDASEATDAGGKPVNPWAVVVKSRTNLSLEQLADGLIDVAWFHTVYKLVGSDKRWEAIEAAAKFLGYGQAHKKATRLADVLLGRTKKKELVENIRKKFLKESVKLLGLLPLPGDSEKRQAELADRYRAMKDYERYARGLSSLSKEPALQAARLGLENLAVTAGFPDPVRLEWAVTAGEVADLAAGPVTVSVGPVTVALSLSPLGVASVEQAKAGVPLAKLPPDVKKHAAVAELLERKKALTRTVAGSKRSLEEAMCAGSRFRGSELPALLAHPLVRPLLERLILKTPAGLGYPVNGGKSLQGTDGKKVPVKAADEWTIAHPLDFVAAGTWAAWQAECFRAERVQPFKQVFREVYVPTAAEKEDVFESRRYSGQQVNETQAKALFAARGWSTREGIDKTFRDAGLVAQVDFDTGYSTPAEAAAPAVGSVSFRRRGDWKPVKLTDVPAVLFSEAMRDLDLVVSVAHVGGVDPEATQSTTEMRAALVATACTLLKLANVKLDGKHALIAGEYGHYSVHLGSAVVHKQPGGALCVVAVNAQHRGRLFLPFADDDPRTAEVVSKVLLLARDREIQDPTILEQIVGR